MAEGGERGGARAEGGVWSSQEKNLIKKRVSRVAREVGWGAGWRVEFWGWGIGTKSHHGAPSRRPPSRLEKRVGAWRPSWRQHLRGGGGGVESCRNQNETNKKKNRNQGSPMVARVQKPAEAPQQRGMASSNTVKVGGVAQSPNHKKY